MNPFARLIRPRPQQTQPALPRQRDVVRVYDPDRGTQKGHTSEPALVVGRAKVRDADGKAGLELDVLYRDGTRGRVPFDPRRVDTARGDPVAGRLREPKILSAAIAAHRGQTSRQLREASKPGEQEMDL